LNLGVPIYDEQGGLIAGPGLIISVLPALFDQIGLAGILVSLAFFILMTIASLTSSISMLEVPLAYVVENYNTSRRRVGTWLTLGITAISLLIVFNFDTLFDLVVSLTTEYSQPLLGFFFAIFAGWVWHRNGILQEIRQGSENVEHTMFWRIWPVYVKFVVPVAILAIYLQTLLG